MCSASSACCWRCRSPPPPACWCASASGNISTARSIPVPTTAWTSAATNASGPALSHGRPRSQYPASCRWTCPPPPPCSARIFSARRQCAAPPSSTPSPTGRRAWCAWWGRQARQEHLAAIFAAKAGARTIKAADLARADVPEALAHGALVVEDLEPGTFDEAALFHLLNLAREQQAFVLLTARTSPALWPLNTADLASRLRALPKLELAAADDALLAAVLVKLFRRPPDRGGRRHRAVSAAAHGAHGWRARRWWCAGHRPARHWRRSALSHGRSPPRCCARKCRAWRATRLRGR